MMFGKVRLWFKRKSLRRISRSASSKLHETAVVLYTIRKHKPETTDRINRFLDDVLYPAIQDVRNIEDDLCRTLKTTEEQRSTLTLVK